MEWESQCALQGIPRPSSWCLSSFTALLSSFVGVDLSERDLKMHFSWPAPQCKFCILYFVLPTEAQKKVCVNINLNASISETIKKLSGSCCAGMASCAQKIVKLTTLKLSSQIKPWNIRRLFYALHNSLDQACHGSQNTFLVSFQLGSLHHEVHSFLQFGHAGPHHHQDWRARCSGNDGNGRTKKDGMPPTMKWKGGGKQILSSNGISVVLCPGLSCFYIFNLEVSIK